MAAGERADAWPAEGSRDYVLSDSGGWIHLQDDRGLPVCRAARNSNPEPRRRDRTNGRICPLCNCFAREAEQPDESPPEECPACDHSPSSSSSQADIFEHFLTAHGRLEVKDD